MKCGFNGMLRRCNHKLSEKSSKKVEQNVNSANEINQTFLIRRNSTRKRRVAKILLEQNEMRIS